MKDWQDILVAAVAVAFLAYLLWKLRPTWGPKTVKTIAKGVLEARAQARAATTPRDRAKALCQAGDMFADQRRGGLAAVGHYLRALRADPTWPTPVERLRDLLWKDRPRALERILWRRLGAIGWEGETRGVVVVIIRTLADLYRKRLRDRSKARVFERLANEMGT